MVSKTPRSTPSSGSHPENLEAPIVVTKTTVVEKKAHNSTALALVVGVAAIGAAWWGWNQWRYGEQMPAPVFRDGVVVFDGFGETPDGLGLPVEGAPTAESSTLVAVVEEATPVTTSNETLPTSSTIVALPTSPTEAVVAAGEQLNAVVAAPISPVVVTAFSPRAELASQLGLLISAAKANLDTTPELAKALLPWAEEAGDAGLVALLIPLANQDVAAAPENQGPEWLSRWVSIRKVSAAYKPDPVVLDTLIQYYIKNYVTPKTKAPAAGISSDETAPTVTI